MFNVLTIQNKKESKVLRKKAADFDFKKFKKSEIRDMIKKMRAVMKAAQGIGLSANQVGIDLNFFIAEVDNKFYSIFNPKIAKASGETPVPEEGCLSVPDTYGSVPRAEKVTLRGFDSNGKKIKIKAWGLLARVFQHEVDHLNGVLFIDKTKSVQKFEARNSK